MQNVPYDPTSAYAQRTQNKKETYYSKFQIAYNIGGTNVTSKYVSIEGAFLDLTARPELINDKPNNYAKEYVAVYIPNRVIAQLQNAVGTAGFVVDAAGLNVDRSQGLCAINANYASEEIPKLGVHRAVEVADENGNVVTKRALEKDYSIDVMYQSARPGGGVLFRGFAFGEFGISKQVPIGAPAPAQSTTVRLSFKLLGFHAFSKSASVRVIRSKAAKSKYGI